MDREIPEVERRRKQVRAALIVVAVAATVVVVFSSGLQWVRPSVQRRDVQTARVTRGSVQAALEASGTIVPRVEQVMSSPVEARVLRILRRPGERVAAGDELLTLDTATARADAGRLDDRLAQKESELVQLRLRNEDQVAGVRAQLEQKRLDAEILHFTAEQKSKLRSEGLLAEQEARAAEAAARKADIEIRQLIDALSRASRSGEAQMRAASADLAAARRDRAEAHRQLELAMLRADQPGVVTWIAGDVGALVRRGDLLARIADLSAYRVDATISDVHAARLATGARARVRLDGAILGGTVESVDPRIVDGVARFHVALDDPANRQLRPNLRVDVSVFSGGSVRGLVVRRGALGRNPFAFVVRDRELVRVPVRFGMSNEDVIEVLDGLREGDEVVVSDMSEFEDVAALRLR